MTTTQETFEKYVSELTTALCDTGLVVDRPAEDIGNGFVTTLDCHHMVSVRVRVDPREGILVEAGDLWFDRHVLVPFIAGEIVGLVIEKIEKAS